MEGFKTGGQERTERKVNHTEKLKSMLGVISNEINEEAEKNGLKDLVDSNCAISVDGFLRDGENGGIYTAEQIEGDKQEVKRREMEFSGANKPAVQAHFKAHEGLNTPEEIVEHWKKAKEKQKSSQTEMAVTILLHKILKGEFLVVRSADRDDYSGVDNLILNKQTGEIICAFDEVHDEGEGEMMNKKLEKVKKIAMGGGVKIRYGVGIEEGKLKRSKIEKIPVFYLGLKSEELTKLLESLEYGESGENSEFEYETFGKLIKSLRDQKNSLEALALVPDIANKLKGFEKNLEILESFGHKK